PSAGWRRGEPGRRASATAAEPLAIERGRVRAATAATTASALTPGVALAALGEQVLRDRGFLEVLVIDDRGAARRRRDADLRIPHGAEGRRGSPNGRGCLVLDIVARIGRGSGRDAFIDR